jgi:hypothetical protein
VAWSPRLKLCPLLSSICSPQHQCLHWSWTHPNQTTPPLLSGLNPFCHSHLSGNLTVNGLWYAYLIVSLSACICRMGSCFMFRDCPAWPKFVALGYIAGCPLVCRSLLGLLPKSSHEEEDLHCNVWGCARCPRGDQTV